MLNERESLDDRGARMWTWTTEEEKVVAIATAKANQWKYRLKIRDPVDMRVKFVGTYDHIIDVREAVKMHVIEELYTWARR